MKEETEVKKTPNIWDKKEREEEQVSSKEGRIKEEVRAKRNMSLLVGTAANGPSLKPRLLLLLLRRGWGENKHFNQKYHDTCRALNGDFSQFYFQGE